MTSTAIIMTALAIISGRQDQPDLEIALGSSKDEIVSLVENLDGSHLSKIRQTIDILTESNLEIAFGNLDLPQSNLLSSGVAYSTDPLQKIKPAGRC